MSRWHPTGLAISSDGSKVYVAQPGNDTVAVIDTATNAVVDIDPETPGLDFIPVGSDPYRLAVSPDGSSVYVVNVDDDTVSVIDIETNMVVGNPISMPDRFPIDIAFSPDGSIAHVVTGGRDVVYMVDTSTGETITGVSPYRNSDVDIDTVAASPDGQTLYVTHPFHGTITVLSFMPLTATAL